MKHHFMARCGSFFVACLIALLLSCAFVPAFAFADSVGKPCPQGEHWNNHLQQCVPDVGN